MSLGALGSSGVMSMGVNTAYAAKQAKWRGVCARSAYRRDGALHDPFAELTGLLRPAAKSSPPLKSSRAPSAASGHAAPAGPMGGAAGGPSAARPAADDGFGSSAFGQAAQPAAPAAAPQSDANGFETKFSPPEASGSLI